MQRIDRKLIILTPLILSSLFQGVSCRGSTSHELVISDASVMSKPASVNPLLVSVTILEAYEDQVVVDGVQSNRNAPPVGHAVVRLRVENTVQDLVALEIQNIEIRPETGDRPLLSQEIGAMELGGLQIVEPGYHLTNQAGYHEIERVRAVMIYKVAGQLYTAESDPFPVTVNRSLAN
ncbi:hypothetical protein H6G89_23445 [Oscillatoria sp. FACHB-1407]|uniref:hypothetical protein n=1 Tax=Oscillatoria sp. FACHB-1407 TaxID=2692847 RepID=UPI0016823CA2|nr:hypothetical protein [Oscillatoria sp. FACHB-1407]MBD2463961.1 hypothetical protein [Oscillatoria sp. FACHB-1407]